MIIEGNEKEKAAMAEFHKGQPEGRASITGGVCCSLSRRI